MYSKIHIWDLPRQLSRMDWTRPSWTTTTSPGSSSRSTLPPTASMAQDSEAKRMAWPFRPMHKGRKPQGSRQAMSFWGDMTSREKAPRSLDAAWHTASSTLPQRSRAWAMA